MSEQSFLARTRAGLAGFKATIGQSTVERIWHALWAGIFAFVMLVVMFLNPVDQAFWMLQSKVAGQSPSGDIIFIGTEKDGAEQRREVAQALIELDRKGVGEVYLDLVFQPSNDPESDRILANAIEELGPRISLSSHITRTVDNKLSIERTDPTITRNAQQVASTNLPSYLGMEWDMAHSQKIGETQQLSLGTALAGHRPTDLMKSFPIDYGFAAKEIPTINLHDLIGSNKSKSDLPVISGKKVVIGSSAPIVTIPGQGDAPRSYIGIFAAEALNAGRTGFFPAANVLSATLFFLFVTVSFLRGQKLRRMGYFAIVASLLMTLLIGAQLGVRVELSYSVALLSIFSLFRLRSHWSQRIGLINQATGLPTLRALEIQLAKHSNIGHVVVAKVHGYEQVLKTLNSAQQSDYILKLVDRLRAADRDLAVYFDSHFLGWHSQIEDTDALVGHLEGLRAIFAAPLLVGNNSVDVGVTFGISKLDGIIERHIPAALAAVEETSEAHQPIKVAETGSEVDMLWDISLRARIDEAMEAGEIYCVYQPKIDVQSGDMLGVEALVRWHDPARGFISPMHFIKQCEKAGRMEHLTRYVLQSACSAGQLLHFRGTTITMSVNISATLLADMRIVALVKNVIQATRFDPSYLVLEVTETALIPDLNTAADVLHQLKATGASISMDDFGVGAANLETFYGLPFDELKIDRLFISNIAENPKARAIATSIVAMGREAGIAVVAEGMENIEDLAILSEIDCPQVQGYALSRPVSLTNLLKLDEMSTEERQQNMV